MLGMDIRTFRSEITDRLGSGQAVSALNAAFAAGNELLHSASEIRLRTGLPLLVIGGLRKEKYFLIGRWRRIYVDPSCVTYPRKKLRCMDYSTT